MRLRLNEEENVNVKNSPWCGSEKPDVLPDDVLRLKVDVLRFHTKKLLFRTITTLFL